MLRSVLLLFLAFPAWSNAQLQLDTVAVLNEVKQFQKEQNDHYRNKKTSPLNKKERRAFEHHNFWDVSLDYVVKARFEKIEKVDTVVLGTSAGTQKKYQPYAKVYFDIDEKTCELTVYQSLKLREMDEYKDYLFLPFRDATSGKDSYGGGRYLDLTIPDSNEVTLNFNLAYNPYCAYTDGYYCTIPPSNNTLEIPIKAGIKAPEGH